MRYGYYGVVVVFGMLCVSAVSQEQPAASDAPLEFILHPIQKGFSEYVSDRYNSDIEIEFKKEPAYAGRSIRRHALTLSREPLNFIGLAFDDTDLKLYIDRNQNLDLTDDGLGIPAREFSSGFFHISNVEIELTHGNISIPYTMEMYFYGADTFYILINSGWQGEIELAGKQCEISILDTLNGIFDSSDSFRFDHDQHRAARLPFGEIDVRSLPKWINFSGQSYNMECAFRVADGETVVAITFTPITEDLMDVSFEGQHVSRIMLANEERVYGILDWPSPEMRIPSGDYSLSQVDLLDSYSGQPRTAQEIAAGINTTIKTGGPLKQEVAVTRRGLNLVVSYALRGPDGTIYDADSRDGGKPPEFAVYQGDNKVLSGQFEYG